MKIVLKLNMDDENVSCVCPNFEGNKFLKFIIQINLLTYYLHGFIIYIFIFFKV